MREAGGVLDNTVFRDFKASQYPVLFIWFGEGMRILRVDKVDGPGVLPIDGADEFGEPVGVQISMATGELEVQPPPPRELWGDHEAVVAWSHTLCDKPAPLGFGATCGRVAEHEGKCKVQYFTGGDEPGDVGVQTIEWDAASFRTA